jgi:hypothetical protein
MDRPAFMRKGVVVFAGFSLSVAVCFAVEEFELFHGHTWLRSLLEDQAWITIGVLGGLGLLGILVGTMSRRGKSKS